MFITFFENMRDAGIPVSLKEHLSLLEAMKAGCANHCVTDFYYLARACYVKDEKNLDKFDRVFGHTFEGMEWTDDSTEADIPDEWLKKMAELYLSEDERKKIDAMDWDELMETIKKRLEEQKERHEGGNKWIGTAGRSPFGAYGYNPAGIRIGQDGNRNFSAVKVWDKRQFKNLDDGVELGTRNIKVALRKLRRFAREGNPEILDLDDTIKSTAKQGWLDIKMIPEKHNAVKVLLFLDVGGSMDPHIRMVEELFSAARTEFKHLEFFYFHNCIYEGVWQDNARRNTDTIPLMDVLHKYPHDYKAIIVGDASMSPYEISYPGGSVEHWNEEPGELWLKRLLDVYHSAVWLNPVKEQHWDWTASIAMIHQIMEGRMFPLTLEGIEGAMKELKKKQ